MLSPAVLASAMRPFFVPGSMPRSQGATAWMRAYAGYAQSATALPCVLAAPLAVPSSDGPFFSVIDALMASMWASALWAAPGFAGITVPPPPVSPVLLSLGLVGVTDPGSAVQLVSSALHTYTIGLTVTVTSATGVTSVVPIV